MAAFAPQASQEAEFRRIALPPAAEGLLAALMDELAHGVIIAATDGQLLHANHAACHELDRRQLLMVCEGRLQANKPEATLLLHEALQRAAEGKRGLLELGNAREQSMTVAVLPLRQEGAVPVHAALFFARASVCDSIMLCFFARSHGLTSAEEQVLGMLCQGFSAPQAAKQLKVAVSTIRSHVRSLCAKTRSSGVRELVTRIAVLPPVAPAFLHERVH